MTLLRTLTAKVKGETNTDVALPPENFIKDLVDAADREPIQQRAGTFTEYVHVSSLANNFCARQYAIALKEDLPMYETVSGGMRVVWAQGRASEDHLRDAFIQKYGIRNIYANWGCEFHRDSDPKDKHDFKQRMFKPDKCKCGGELNKFHEPNLYENNAKVSGRPDLVFRYRNWMHITEIKSIKSEIDSPNKNQHLTFEELTEPLQTAQNQASFYPDLLKKMEPDFNVSPIVRYVYIAKAFKMGSPYKEFTVDHSTPKWKTHRNELYEEAKQIKEFIETDKLPPRICPSIGSPLAKKCVVSARCFYTYNTDD